MVVTEAASLDTLADLVSSRTLIDSKKTISLSEQAKRSISIS